MKGQSQERFNINLEGGYLKCGSSCLAILPGCVAPTLAAGGALAGGDIGENLLKIVPLSQGHMFFQIFFKGQPFL